MFDIFCYKVCLCKKKNLILFILFLFIFYHLKIIYYSSSPDSLNAERTDTKSPSVSPSGLYKLVIPLLRCETTDVRDAAVQALGKVNSDALK